MTPDLKRLIAVISRELALRADGIGLTGKKRVRWFERQMKKWINKHFDELEKEVTKCPVEEKKEKAVKEVERKSDNKGR